MKPGDTQLTRTCGAHSRAADRVRAITAAFAAEYGASPRVGRSPDTLAMFTTAPPAWRSFGALARKQL